jgi:hypothetical protein
MAPRLIARSFAHSPSGGGRRRTRKGESETDRDLIRHRNPFDHPNRGSYHSSRVKGAAAGGDRSVVRRVGTAPAGV